MSRPLIACVSLLCLAGVAGAEDWPCWRGPRHDGTSAETGLPLHWSASDNIAWKTPLPGHGHASPIVVGDRVFVTTALPNERERVLLCLDRRDGKLLWRRTVLHTPPEYKHKLNSHASATPASDGRHVWTAFLRLRPKAAADGPPIKPREKSPIPPALVPEMVVTCFTVEGERVWEKVPGRFYARHGFCSPPIPYKDTIVLNGDQDAEAYLVALDGATGAERWRVDRPRRFRSYCAPFVVAAGGRMQMVLSGAETITSYDPDTGARLWQIDGPTEQFVAAPVFDRDSGLFFVTCGFPEYHNLAFDAAGKIAWHERRTIAKKAAYVPSPLVVPGHFFVMSDLGWLSCFAAKTGQRTFMEKLGSHHSASPVRGDGHVYLPDDDGVTYVVKAAGQFAKEAENRLGDPCHASPAISRGQLFLRTDAALWCIGKTPEAAR